MFVEYTNGSLKASGTKLLIAYIFPHLFFFSGFTNIYWSQTCVKNFHLCGNGEVLLSGIMNESEKDITVVMGWRWQSHMELEWC